MCLVYLLLGMATTTMLWTTMQDEIDLALGSELDDDDDTPAFRVLLSFFFMLVWPMLFWDAVNKR